MQPVHPPGACKLFIGQVPRVYTAEQLKPLFEPYGSILEVVIIKDKATGQSKGCAFVVFSTKAEADAAIQSLHMKITLPGASNMMQVKYADSGGQPADWKLFIGMLPRTATEEDLRPIFMRFGNIAEVAVIRGPAGDSKGYGFVRYHFQQEAQAAINALNGAFQMDGAPGPLIVKFADAGTKRRELGGVGMGLGMGVNLGMGSIGTMAPINLAALTALSPQAMQLRLQQQALQQQIQMQQIQQIAAGAAMPAAAGLVTPVATTPILPAPLPASTPAAPVPAPTGGIGNSQEGPPGCNVFVYHVPTEFSDSDLASIFQPFGNLVSTKVFIDKQTGLSRGFGFVSFDNPESAQMAISSMNGFQIGTKRLKVQLKRQNTPF